MNSAHARPGFRTRRGAFDPVTGQVFVECLLPARASLRQPGVPDGRVRKPRNTNNSSSAGPSSLHDLALNKILRNILELTPEHIAALPWTVQRRLWDVARWQRPELLLAVWKLLAAASPEDDRWQYLHQSSIDHDHVHACNLPGWLPRLDSPSFAWLTALTVSSVDCSRQDLINLSNLKNLAALDICGKRHPGDKLDPRDDWIGHESGFVDQRLIWHWTERAKHDGAFRELRVLIVRSERAVSKAIAPFLRGLPALALFGSEDCTILPSDQQSFLRQGWENCEWPDSLLDLDFRNLNKQIDMQTSWDGALRVCAKRTEVYREAKVNLSRKLDGQEAIKEGQYRDPPLLNFRLGQTPAGTLFSKSITFYRNIHLLGMPMNPAVRPPAATSSETGAARLWENPFKYPTPATGTARPHSAAEPAATAKSATTKARRPLRNNARLDLAGFFEDVGARATAVRVDMERAETVTEPAHAFASGKASRDRDKVKATTLTLLTTSSKDGFRDTAASGPASTPTSACLDPRLAGSASTPGTPPAGTEGDDNEDGARLLAPRGA